MFLDTIQRIIFCLFRPISDPLPPNGKATNSPKRELTVLTHFSRPKLSLGLKAIDEKI
jgi:hypothetical protein